MDRTLPDDVPPSLLHDHYATVAGLRFFCFFFFFFFFLDVLIYPRSSPFYIRSIVYPRSQAGCIHFALHTSAFRFRFRFRF